MKDQKEKEKQWNKYLEKYNYKLVNKTKLRFWEIYSVILFLFAVTTIICVTMVIIEEGIFKNNFNQTINNSVEVLNEYDFKPSTLVDNNYDFKPNYTIEIENKIYVENCS